MPSRDRPRCPVCGLANPPHEHCQAQLTHAATRLLREAAVGPLRPKLRPRSRPPVRKRVDES
jgi:hypothetical protein